MNTKITRLFALLAIVGMAFVGCQKDDGVEPQKEDAMLGKKTFLGKYKMNPKKRLKGLLDNEYWLDTSRVVYTIGQPSEQYKTIRVTRPNGRDFYIMIENLRYEDYNSPGYNFDESNVPEYGRLYTYDHANNLRNKVYMKLPIIKVSTGDTIRDGLIIRGHLPLQKDIEDLLEVSSIGDITEAIPLEDNYISDNMYFDAFIAGIDLNPDPASANHSLGGQYLFNLPGVTHKFQSLNHKGLFWLRDLDGTTYDYDARRIFVLSKSYEDDSFCSYVKNHPKYVGLSVRYIFEPIYK